MCENKTPGNGKITLQFANVVNLALVANFNIANMSFDAIRESNILAKITNLHYILKLMRCSKL